MTRRDDSELAPTWFGFWREDGAEFAECPSVFEWVDPSWRVGVAVDRITNYLDSSPFVVATSADRCVICKQLPRRTLAFRTDGMWYWPDTLSHYVARHDVRLPDAFHARIAGAEYMAPRDLWMDESGFVRALKRLNVPPGHRDMIQCFISQH